MNTAQLIRALPARRRACCSSCAQHAFGAVSAPDVQGLAIDAAGMVQAAIDRVAALPATIADSIADATIGTARRQIAAAQAALAEAARQTARAGAGAVADSLAIMAGRAGEALVSLGEGAGAAFRSFWGLPPAAVFGLPLVLAGAALLALALSPGGQGYVLSVGRGLGGATSSIAAGWGDAARHAGRALPAIVGAL